VAGRGSDREFVMRTSRTGSADSRCSGRRCGACRARCRVQTTGCEIDAELEPATPNAVIANKSAANIIAGLRTAISFENSMACLH
jgi:hypothetical protein